MNVCRLPTVAGPARRGHERLPWSPGRLGLLHPRPAILAVGVAVPANCARTLASPLWPPGRIPAGGRLSAGGVRPPPRHPANWQLLRAYGGKLRIPAVTGRRTAWAPTDTSRRSPATRHAVNSSPRGIAPRCRKCGWSVPRASPSRAQARPRKSVATSTIASHLGAFEFLSGRGQFGPALEPRTGFGSRSGSLRTPAEWSWRGGPELWEQGSPLGAPGLRGGRLLAGWPRDESQSSPVLSGNRWTCCAVGSFA